MVSKGRSPEQNPTIPREVESGKTVAEVCRQAGISSAKSRVR
jgi:hypothetical protein